ncbi:MAG: hypothetical protein PHI59_10690 [Candidatus Omnitrophica bacterium]|nr:hypothetical protein [Candidatus Omnitrophota bacterium]
MKNRVLYCQLDQLNQIAKVEKLQSAIESLRIKLKVRSVERYIPTTSAPDTIDADMISLKNIFTV